MKPTIGRIVLFNLPQDYWQFSGLGNRVRPAIVTRAVDADGPPSNRVNLRVIYDPTDVFIVEARHQVNVDEGAEFAGHWFWPPRV